ncbi:hypothetical protein [Polaribacter sp. Q13]|uniref:GT-D fold domain-containing protein n=1 Tax=Polaribacter sp. Q13 TaxID=2806551 RepID=UPI00193B3360|nr:hypothetical protein [Polaribacter sp. Q13]QVY66630.1 hypothetical protein JOP69_04915 [Polaribacter sp. Q13]
MTKILILFLKSLRKIYGKLWKKEPQKPLSEQDPNKASQIIYDALIADKPCMIARFGSTELTTLVNYLGVKQTDKNIFKYVQGKTLPWWWNEGVLEQMQRWSGFFPPTVSKIEQFCELMIADIPQVDVLGSWLVNEKYFDNLLSNAEKIDLLTLDPFWSDYSWTRGLEGKKILVIHPFTETIVKQYQKRELLFENNLLPEFELKTIKAVQSIAGEKTQFQDWFEALNYMKSEIDKQDYDICLIGAGAYGFPLAAHIKRNGKKVIHIGGSLQLLFGIRGKRWENWDETTRNGKILDYKKLMNKHWVYPGMKETPKNSKEVESSCYW